LFEYQSLMVRSVAQRRVSNHAAESVAALVLRDAHPRDARMGSSGWGRGERWARGL